jgi:hypothetical protein
MMGKYTPAANAKRSMAAFLHHAASFQQIGEEHRVKSLSNIGLNQIYAHARTFHAKGLLVRGHATEISFPHLGRVELQFLTGLHINEMMWTVVERKFLLQGLMGCLKEDYLVLVVPQMLKRTHQFFHLPVIA